MTSGAVLGVLLRRARSKAWAASALLASAPLAVASAPTEATDRPRPFWSVEGFVGAAVNLPTNLNIRQEGQPDIDVVGRYETRPFQAPIYYAVRAGRWKGPRAWEIELIHHKLYLANPPGEVRHFSVSHGFNVVTLTRAWKIQGAILRAGAGLALIHPENEVRGLPLDETKGPIGAGYHVTGPVVQGAVGRRFPLGRGVFFALEGKATLARAVIPVAGGRATTSNAAVHLLAGIGYHPAR